MAICKLHEDFDILKPFVPHAYGPGNVPRVAAHSGSPVSLGLPCSAKRPQPVSFSVRTAQLNGPSKPRMTGCIALPYMALRDSLFNTRIFRWQTSIFS